MSWIFKWSNKISTHNKNKRLAEYWRNKFRKLRLCLNHAIANFVQYKKRSPKGAKFKDDQTDFVNFIGIIIKIKFLFWDIKFLSNSIKGIILD